MTFHLPFWSMGLAGLTTPSFPHSDSNFVLLLRKFCLKTHQISFCFSSLKTQFWEFFTATNFSEENNLTSSKIVNGSGKGFSEGREAAWMEKKIRLSPGTENLALSFQKKKTQQQSLSVSGNGCGTGEWKFRNIVLMIHLPWQNPKRPSCLGSMGKHLGAIFSLEMLGSKQTVRSGCWNKMHRLLEHAVLWGCKTNCWHLWPTVFQVVDNFFNKVTRECHLCMEGSLCVLQQVSSCSTSPCDFNLCLWYPVFYSQIHESAFFF